MAHALETTATVDAQGWTVVSATLPHTKEHVDAFLSAPTKTMKLGDGVRDVQSEPMDNGCTKLHVTNNGFAKTLSYASMRCPIEGGWHSKMISSDDFEQHDIQWVATPDGATTVVSIRVKVSLKAPIPDFLIRSIVTKGLTQTLTRLDMKLSITDLAPPPD
jgi:hypothetical protein